MKIFVHNLRDLFTINVLSTIIAKDQKIYRGLLHDAGHIKVIAKNGEEKYLDDAEVLQCDIFDGFLIIELKEYLLPKKNF
jgi:hypothetical protein